MNNFTIIIDKKEQLPVLFDKAGSPNFPDMQVEWGTLKTGDYSIKGFSSPDCPHSVCIERKSLADLFGSAGRGRDRLKKEFIRMSKFDHAEIVTERDLQTIFKHPPPLSMMRPKAVYRTLVAWSQRYNVKVWPCPNRVFMEKHIYLTLKRFFDDRQKNGKEEFCKL